MPERLADQNSGPRVGGHQRWVFPLCIEHKRKRGFWGGRPHCADRHFWISCLAGSLALLQRDRGELGKRGGQDWGSLGMGTVR